MNISSQYVVAYIDMLGVKNYISSDTGNHLVHAIKNIISNMKNLPLLMSEEDHIKIKAFSDNIIIARSVTEDIEDQRTKLHQMIALAETLQWLSLFQYDILLRGGIVIGDLYIDDDFTIGQALVQAYNLEDKLAIYPRVVIDDSLSKLIQENAHTLIDNDGFIYIDFLSMANNERTLQDVLSRYNKIIQSGLSSEKDKRVIQKLKWCENYKNTWIKNNNRREKMLKLREELLAVEEDRAAGSTGIALDELDTYLDEVIDK